MSVNDKELGVKFKKSMFEVKSDMGEDKFVAMCPFCKELLNQASDYIIQANERLKVLREGEAKKADDLTEKIRLAEIAEKQRLENKADELAEKIRLAEITRAVKLRKEDLDLAEKIRLAKIIRAEKLRKEDLELAEKVRTECRERDEKVRKKLEDKEDAEKVAAAKLCLDANQSSEALAMQNRRIYACHAFSEIKERLSGISEMVNISLDPLGDHRLFQLSKATNGINSDFNEVLAKITLLVSSTGVESGKFMEILNPLKDVIAAKEVYMKNLW